MVATPSAVRRASAFGPTPIRARTGSGARKAASVPGATTQTCSGRRLATSLAILATRREVARPRETEIPVRDRTRARRASAGAGAKPAGQAQAASSIELCCTRGLASRSTAITRCE